jgi:hypothetical protein
LKLSALFIVIRGTLIVSNETSTKLRKYQIKEDREEIKRKRSERKKERKKEKIEEIKFLLLHSPSSCGNFSDTAVMQKVCPLSSRNQSFLRIYML